MTRLPRAASAARRVSAAAQAASAAAAGSVAARRRICSVAWAAVRAACSQMALRSAQVSPPGVGPVPPAAGCQRWRSLGSVRSAASLPPLYQTGLPALVVSVGRATAYPVIWPGLRVLSRVRTRTPALREVGEELLFAGCGGRCGGDVAFQGDPGGLGPAFAAGFLVFCAGGAAGGGAISRCGALQAVPVLGGSACLADAVPLVGGAEPAAVLAGEHRHDVDVVIAVPDRDPADRVVLLRRTGDRPVRCMMSPAICAHSSSDSIRSRGAARTDAMPDRAVEAPAAERGVGLVEQPVQAPEVPAAVGAERRLQFGRVAPPGDDVRIGVLLVPAGAEQVVDQPLDPLPARFDDLPDHRRRLRMCSAAASRRSALRRLSAAYGTRSPERCPVALSFATA